MPRVNFTQVKEKSIFRPLKVGSNLWRSQSSEQSWIELAWAKISCDRINFNEGDWREVIHWNAKTKWRFKLALSPTLHVNYFVQEGSHSFTYSGTMGKEQDLLQAAKTGNVAHIEKILGNKTRKSGIQRYLGAVLQIDRKWKLIALLLSFIDFHAFAVWWAGPSTLIIKTNLDTLRFIMQH